MFTVVRETPVHTFRLTTEPPHVWYTPLVADPAAGIDGAFFSHFTAAFDVAAVLGKFRARVIWSSGWAMADCTPIGAINAITIPPIVTWEIGVRDFLTYGITTWVAIKRSAG
jgi:hypothetical protein